MMRYSIKAEMARRICFVLARYLFMPYVLFLGVSKVARQRVSVPKSNSRSTKYYCVFVVIRICPVVTNIIIYKGFADFPSQVHFPDFTHSVLSRSILGLLDLIRLELRNLPESVAT